jgi:hypothetical protein
MGLIDLGKDLNKRDFIEYVLRSAKMTIELANNWFKLDHGGTNSLVFKAEIEQINKCLEVLNAD